MRSKLHISDIIENVRKGHSNLNFVDININDDQKLFIDPVLISLERGEWFVKADSIIQNYFDVLYGAYKSGDNNLKNYVLKHAVEVNHTKLGYGNGKNGHGNRADNLIKVFEPLESLCQSIDTIKKSVDIPIFINGFNEDGLSDLITNIIHEELNQFTLNELQKYEIEANSEDEYFTWDMKLSQWIKVKRPYFSYDGNKLLLVPKAIVRKKYLFSAGHFLRMAIVEREREKYISVDVNGKESYAVTKKYLINNIPKDNPNWRYAYTQSHSIKDSKNLSFYHNRLNSLYVDKGLSNSELDHFIYLKNK